MRPKLTAPKPLVAKLAPLVTQSPTDEVQRSRYRNSVEPRRSWYKLKRWLDLRQQVFTEDLYRCRRCGTTRGPFHCDHRQPHNWNPTLFWDRENLWTLCATCHDSWKQQQERRAAHALVP